MVSTLVSLSIGTLYVTSRQTKPACLKHYHLTAEMSDRGADGDEPDGDRRKEVKIKPQKN